MRTRAEEKSALSEKLRKSEENAKSSTNDVMADSENLAESTAQIAELPARITALEKDKADISTELAVLKEKNAQELTVQKQLMTDNENLAQRLAELQSTVDRQCGEKERLATQVEEQELRAQLAHSNQTITDQCEEISQWKVKNKIIAAELEATEGKKMALAKAIDAYEGEQKEMKALESVHVTQLRVEVQDLSEKLQFSDAALKTATTEKSNVTEKMKQLVDCIRQAEQATESVKLEVETEKRLKMEVQLELEDVHNQSEREIKNLGDFRQLQL